MKTLNLALAHCYGIRKLEAILDYSKSQTVSIYAPNGAMKSSLAKTFQDIADGKESKDRVFQERVTTRGVTDEAGAELPADGILVLRPYEETPGQNPAGHPKLPHLWPVKLPQAGRSDYAYSAAVAMREAASFRR